MTDIILPAQVVYLAANHRRVVRLLRRLASILGLAGRAHLIFCSWCFLLSFFWSWRSFVRSSPYFATSSVVMQIYKIGSEIWGPSTKKIWWLQNVGISNQFRTTLRLDRKLSPEHHRDRQLENNVANYNHSHTCTLNFVNFGPQTEKNRARVLTHPKSTFGRPLSRGLRGSAPV